MTVVVFTWARIMFRKTFWIAIQNVIGIVIWTTCVHMHCKRLMHLCIASARIFKMHTHESRSERALRSHVLESGFLGGSRSRTPFFRVSKRVSKVWFETALCSHGPKSGFQIRKGPNHILKRLSERDSSPCEHSHCYMIVFLGIAQ